MANAAKNRSYSEEQVAHEAETDGGTSPGHGVADRSTLSVRRVREELESQRRFLRKVIDTVPGFIFVKDWNSRFLLANRAVSEAYGTTPDGMLGKSDVDFNANPAEVAAFNRDDREVIESRKEKQILEEPVTDSHGVTRWLTTVKVPLIDDDGGCTSLLGVSTDITALKQAEDRKLTFDAQLRETQKLESLGILAGGVAHDFNNLLGGILGNLELAMLEVDPGRSRACLELARTAALRAADLTQQMLAYSGKGRMSPEVVDYNSLLEGMIELLRASFVKKIELCCELQPGLPSVEADVNQLRQVLMNLVINAAEAIGDRPGMIHVRTGMEKLPAGKLAGNYTQEQLAGGQYVWLEVSDNGCGMEEQTRRRLFDPFFTTKFSGRGLGLSAVLGIIRAHRGAILVESAIGAGSRFRILLPAAAVLGKMLPGDAPVGETAWRGSGRVLVVDDEEMVRGVAAKMLEHLGFEVLHARDGVEALSLFRAGGGDFALVLLDMTMPHLSGEDVVTAMRALRPDMKILLSSGYSEPFTLSRLGGVAFLQKPFTMESLTQRVQQLTQL